VPVLEPAIFRAENAAFAAVSVRAEAAVARERTLLDAIFTRNSARMADLMAEEGFGVDAVMGCVSQHELIADIDRLSADAAFEMDRIRVVFSDHETSVLVYLLRQWGRFGESVLPPAVWCTSVWSSASGEWQAIFHQETPEASALGGR
jgi:hypothetical protein